MAAERDVSATIMGLSMKHFSLSALTIQNSALILCMHYSRVMPLVNGQRYLPSTAVLIAEVMKLTISLTMALSDVASKQPDLPATAMFSSLAKALFFEDSWKLCIPAALFTLQSSLHFVAVSHLGAATFQVTNELKILTTALFSVILLGRKIPLKQWAALFLLTLGVGIVMLPVENMADDFKSLRDHSHPNWWMPRSLDEWKSIGQGTVNEIKKRSASYQGIEDDMQLQTPRLDSSVGFASALIGCVSSGLASVVFEKILKDPKNYAAGNKLSGTGVSLWIRNVQLSLYSLIPAFFIGVVYKDGHVIAENGFLAGYNWAVWLTIALQAAGGIIVALVISYANSIAKNFATSISIILSTVISIAFFDMEVSFPYLFGTGVVIAATWLYNGKTTYSHEPRIKLTGSRPPPILIDTTVFEKGMLTPRLEQGSGFFDVESVGSPLRSGDKALTTSRPSTPGPLERHHFRVASGRRQFDKRAA